MATPRTSLYSRGMAVEGRAASVAVRRIWRGFNGARPAPGVATRHVAVARASRPSSGTWRWGASCARRVRGHPGGVAVPCGAVRRVAHVHVRGRVEEQRARTVGSDGGAADAAACARGRAAGCCGGERRGGRCGGRAPARATALVQWQGRRRGGCAARVEHGARGERTGVGRARVEAAGEDRATSRHGVRVCAHGRPGRRAGWAGGMSVRAREQGGCERRSVGTWRRGERVRERQAGCARAGRRSGVRERGRGGRRRKEGERERKRKRKRKREKKWKKGKKK